MYAMHTNGWKSARARADLIGVRIHDLRHTFGRRLRATGVSYEDRQDLLGHKSSRMTTHYSAAEIKNLIDAANKLCDTQVSTPTLKVIQGGC
jgi:integrase